MAKKSFRICNWSCYLVKICVLNGALLPGFTLAQAADTSTLQQDGVTAIMSLPGSDLYLDVTLNGNPVGLTHLSYHDGKIYASARVMRQLGLRAPGNPHYPVALEDITGLQVDYNIPQQILSLTAPLDTLDLAPVQVNAPDARSASATASHGVLLNYDLYGQQGDTDGLNSFSELRAFNALGVLSTSQLTQYSSQQYSDNAISRLDTLWRSVFPDSMLALTLGDTITGSLAWSRPTRIGGIQVGTDFGLKPYMPTTPLPAFLGSATLPSSVELFVNGARAYKGQVPSGRFEINTTPNISGAGNAQLVMTDALGRTAVQNFSFYSDQQLLRDGLTAWSAEFGVVRKDYGYASFDYASQPAISATWRHGFSNTLTAGTHGEASGDLVNGGVSSDWIPGQNSGVISTSLAASRDHGSRKGYLYGLGYRWSAERLNFSTNTFATAGNYRDVATRYGLRPPTLTSSVVAGYGLDSLGNISVNYLQSRYPGQGSIRYVGANWYKAINDSVYLNAGINQNMDDKRDRNLFLTLTVTPSANIIASLGAQRTASRDGVQFNASQTPQDDGGWGWNVAASQLGSQQNGQGEVGYLGRHGKVYAGGSSITGSKYGYVGANGSLVAMGGGLFAARQITNGFAVISTTGIPDVPVKLQNNLIGQSDSHGLLLVTSLNSYQNNLISIDPMSLPANMRIDRINANAVPADRAGALIEFAITPVRAAQIKLVDPQGQAIAQGSTVQLIGDVQQTSVVGFDGMAWFESLNPHNQLQVDTATGQCSAAFDYPTTRQQTIREIGPVVCR